jgi:hypothetical protein
MHVAVDRLASFLDGDNIQWEGTPEMRMISKMLPLAVILLAGCQSTQMASTPRSVTYGGVSDFTIQETTTKAQVHCSQFGRDAELVPDGVNDGRATFRCIDK